MKASALAALAIAGALAACDPCLGVAGCGGSPAIGLSGRILDEDTGKGAGGVVIDVVRTGGAALARDSVRVVTDGEGLFTVELPAAASGGSDAIVDVVVSPPGLNSYRARGLRVPVTSTRGEALVLPAWSNRPTLPDLAVAYRRGVPPQTFTNVNATFRRTGGTAVTGLVNETFTTTSGADGWFALFARQVKPATLDELVGELTVAQAAPFQTRTVRIQPAYEFKRHSALLSFGFGPNIEYHFFVADRGHTDRGVGNTLVEFQRTGGIQVTNPTWSAVTDASGRLAFPGMAQAFGDLTGRLTVTPPSPWKAIERDIVLTAFDADGARLFDTLFVGPGLPYMVRIRNGAQPLAGVEVEFQRTGGIAVAPERFVVKTNALGQAFVEPDPEIEGIVTADITVRPPAPFASFTVRGVQMQAIDGDRPSRHVLLGDWDVNAPPANPGSNPGNLRSRP